MLAVGDPSRINLEYLAITLHIATTLLHATVVILRAHPLKPMDTGNPSPLISMDLL